MGPVERMVRPPAVDADMAGCVEILGIMKILLRV